MSLGPKELVERAAEHFSKRTAITTLWQEIAENFYPQRADFTLTRYIGEEFANHLHSSYPLLVHRELSGAIAGMLRPRRKNWFATEVDEYDELSKGAKEWLEWATKRQKKAMYDRKARFVRATTEGDADWSAFGQCCITRDINWNMNPPHLVYHSWHLRDIAWSEKADGSIGEIYIKWKPTIKELREKYGEDKLHSAIKSLGGTQTLVKHNCMRLTLSTDVYQGQGDQFEKFPWVRVILDMVNFHIIEEKGLISHGVTLPRWQTVSGSQYAYSPATVAGLPDARLLQAMTLTLLEAGEMSVRPPMIATQNALRSEIALYSGGITYVDVEYDERKGDVLRPLNQDRRGLPIGYDVHDQQRAMLAEAFYINKLTLPPTDGTDMTAYEVGERIEEYIRAALPLFEPMEDEYNGALCEDTFMALLSMGTFGAIPDIPEELRGKDIHFRFVSPLHDAIERKDASIFVESADLIERAMALDPTSVAQMDIQTALRDALKGVGLAEKHLRSSTEIDRILDAIAEQKQTQEAAALAEQGGKAAANIAKAQQLSAPS